MGINTLTTEQKTQLVKDLIKFSKYQAGIKAGFKYKKKRSLLSAVDRVLKEVRSKPEEFNISQEALNMVQESLSERKIVKVSKQGQELPTEAEEALNSLTIKQLAEKGTKSAFVLLNRKLNLLLGSNTRLNKLSITALAKTLGIVFDKRQLTRGEATESSIIYSGNMEDLEKLTTEQKLDLLLGGRQKHIETK